MALSNVKQKKRLFALLLGIAFIFVILLGRILWLQIIDGPMLQEKASKQWISNTTVEAQRGKILDASGKELALSSNSTSIMIQPQLIKDDATAETVAQKLSELLSMDKDEILKKAKDKTKSETWIKRQLDQSVADTVRAADLTGVKLVIETKRYYPQHNLASQVIGLTDVDGVGQSGLESYYNKYLEGEDGSILSETDRKGQDLAFGTKEQIPATDGNNVVLTIDSTIQYFVDREMELAEQKNKPAGGVRCVVMNPQTGAILAMGGKEDLDLNDPPRTDAEQLNAQLRNSCVVDAYEPGSTFKILTLTAALSEGVVDLNSTFDCNGSYQVAGDRPVKCWQSSGHGHQTLAEAVEHSCNVAFAQMAERMGTETFYKYLESMGIGQKTGIDFPGESAGILINEEDVKLYDLVRIGFGQSISVTPLQLLTAACASINGGNLMRPYLMDRIETTDGTVIEKTEAYTVRKITDEQTSQTVSAILENVVSNGSGSQAFVDGYHVGGKTGTAQKYENGQIKQGANISSFIGFAPMDDPQIAVLFIVDEPTDVSATFGSVVAAPHVREIIKDSLEYLGVEPDYGEDGERENISVPDVRNKTVSEAKAALQAAGLTYTDTQDGYVTGQFPAPGVKVYEGTAVLLEVSSQAQSTAQPSKEPSASPTSSPTGSQSVAYILPKGNADVQDFNMSWQYRMMRMGSG